MLLLFKHWKLLSKQQCQTAPIIRNVRIRLHLIIKKKKKDSLEGCHSINIACVSPAIASGTNKVTTFETNNPFNYEVHSSRS